MQRLVQSNIQLSRKWLLLPKIAGLLMFNVGDFASEISSRRIEDTSNGLATVMKRTFYLLDKHNGATLWSFPLQGSGITDWRVKKQILVYAAADSSSGEEIHAAVDLSKRKQLWLLSRIPAEGLYQPQWVMVTEDSLALYGTSKDGTFFDTGLTAHNLLSGKVVWHVPNKLEDATLVRESWFIYKNYLCAITAPRSGGLYLEKYDIASGKKFEPEPIIGVQEKSPGNKYIPIALTPDGTLFFEFHPFVGKFIGRATRDEKLSIAAYNLDTKELRWQSKLYGGNEVRINSSSLDKYVKNIAVDPTSDAPLIATIYPNIFAIINPKNGEVIKMQAMPDYVEWSDHSAILYSYPYVFAGALHLVNKGKAYDLVALNLESGHVVWSYEISGTDKKLDEILNFVVSDDAIYVSRADGRIMAFQFGIRKGSD